MEVLYNYCSINCHCWNVRSLNAELCLLIYITNVENESQNITNLSSQLIKMLIMCTEIGQNQMSNPSRMDQGKTVHIKNITVGFYSGLRKAPNT